jgi:hypothetical protein
MKNLFRIVALLTLVAVGSAADAASPAGGYPATVGGSRAGGPQEFRAELDIDYCYSYLSPYGTWVRFEPYGYVWRPRHMGYRWRPYSEGHWLWTDYGWTWMDDADWGWIPFHYGRWGWDDDLGWYWVPGTVWGPAWVAWRSSDTYMGWAPILPGVEFRAGMDFAALSIRIPGSSWIFIGGAHFLDPEIRANVLPIERNVTIVNYTTAHDNFSFRGNRLVNEGVGIDTVRRVTRRDVTRFSLQDSPQPGPARTVGTTVQIYRPSFRGNAGAGPKTSLDREQARRELAPTKVFEPREQAPARSAESAVRQHQAEEKALLEKTQSQELKDIQRRAADEANRARNASEKAKIEQEYRARASALQKQHQAESRQLVERQKRDAEQIRQARAANQEAPPKKKK